MLGSARKTGSGGSRDDTNDRVNELLRSIPEPPMFEGPWVHIVAGIAICLASFMGTLWLTEPQEVFEGPKVPQRIENFQKARVFNRDSLNKEAQSVALFPSLGLRAVLDSVSRRPEGRAELIGWAANPASDGSPIVLMAFIKERSVMIGKTEGSRADVTRALGLSEAAARNVVIAHTIDCPAESQFMFVAIDEKGGYFALDPRYCP